MNTFSLEQEPTGEVFRQENLDPYKERVRSLIALGDITTAAAANAPDDICTEPF